MQLNHSTGEAMKWRKASLLVCSAVAVAACATSPATTPDPPASAGVAMPTGCGADTGPGPVVLAVAGHANIPTPFISTAMNAAITATATQHDAAPIGVVDVDGSPRLINAGRFTSDAGNPSAQQQDRDLFLSAVNATIQGVRATAAHVDYLRALQVASDAAHASCATRGTVIVEGSGLQDTGALDFARDDLLIADPALIVDFLRQHEQLPDLHQLRIVFTALGDTTAPQTPLDQASRDNLIRIWSAIATAAGAASVEVDRSPHAGPAAIDVPAVSTVEVPAPVAFPASCSVHNFKLPDIGPVGFEPDRADLRDPAAARQVIIQIATALHGCPGARILLTGATSSYGELTPAGDEQRQALSLARAETVKALLIDSGVVAQRIDTAGNGYHFDDYIVDRDADGNLLPGPATQNRCVLVSVTP
jgi:outer membrane protein OmpA-like peptidoglycan-associated protein